MTRWDEPDADPGADLRAAAVELRDQHGPRCQHGLVACGDCDRPMRARPRP